MVQIWSFIMLVLSISIKVVLRSIALLGINLMGYSLSTYAVVARDDDGLICVYNLSGNLATYFFQLSIFLNALRWIILVLDHKQVKLSEFGLYICRFLILFDLSYLTAIIIFQSYNICTLQQENITLYKLALILFGVGLQITNLWIVITLGYSCYFFCTYYQQQIKRNPNRYHDEEVNQIQKSSYRITKFFIQLIFIIIVRQIPYMMNMFTVIFNAEKDISVSMYVYTILYFVPELALIAIMSQSIRWSLFTYQKYLLQESVKKDTMTDDESLQKRDSIIEDRSHLLYAICEDDSFSNSSLIN
ncbi:UNKNOWN [Stylonychia lemnae]|uniref:G-protein coupled receptors family 1 profile domain-containing protein n=1 Tax=Stylonychia lemnae TaxID=5949 RepID=A0A078AMG4_STYLE|nr:UNKNOWN [Stylonychia lemnae]|eukprot:CDW83364.1 UNKNOWN [Stylonychia lemnae]